MLKAENVCRAVAAEASAAVPTWCMVSSQQTKILHNQHHHHPSGLSKTRHGRNKNNGFSPTGNRTLASCELFQRNDKQKY